VLLASNAIIYLETEEAGQARCVLAPYNSRHSGLSLTILYHSMVAATPMRSIPFSNLFSVRITLPWPQSVTSPPRVRSGGRTNVKASSHPGVNGAWLMD
jgi:hypothetical protein